MVIADTNNPIQRKIRRHKLFLAYLKTAERLHRECGKSIKDASYITSEILTDNDIDLLEEEDEDFVSVKNLIAETFPNAFPAPKAAEPEKPVKTEPTVEDYIAALEGAEIQFEFSKGKEKKNLKEYIDGLKVMIETMGENMGKGGRIPSANARERKYTSKNQKHEQRYKKNRVTKIRYYKKQK